MVDSRVVRIVGRRERFGTARAWGSAGFVVVAFLAGATIDRLGPAGMFAINGPLLFATGIAAWALLRPARLDPGPRMTRTPSIGATARNALAGLAPSTILGVLTRPKLGPLFIALLAIWSSNSALLGFLSLRVVELGGDAAVIAATWSIGALIEVPLMLGFPRLAGRIGAERLIVIGAFAFAFRALASALATAPWQIVAVSAFGGFGYAFVYVGTVTWVAGSVSRSTQATAQGIFTGTTSSVGTIGGSIIGGAIGAAFGLPVLFAIAAAGYALGGVLVWRAIARVGSPRAGGAEPLAEEVELAGHERVGDRALAEERPGAADDGDRPSADLAEGQLRGRRDLVGAGPDRRLHDPAVGVGRSRGGPRSGSRPDTPIATSVMPQRHGPAERVRDDHRDVDPEPRPDRRRGSPAPTRRGRAAGASRSGRWPARHSTRRSRRWRRRSRARSR